MEAGRKFLRERGVTQFFTYVSDDFDDPLPEDFRSPPSAARTEEVVQLLLDTNVPIALSRDEIHKLERKVATVVGEAVSQSFASDAFLWEIAIKTRLGKLDPARPLEELPDHFWLRILRRGRNP